MLLTLASALLLAVLQPTWGPKSGSPNHPPAPQRIGIVTLLKYQLLQTQMQLVLHEACDEAGIAFQQCRAQWDAGIVVNVGGRK